MIGCLRVPYCAAALEGQRDRTLRGGPLVFIRYDQRGGKVIALSASAEAVGVQLGLSVTRARALCPQGKFITSDADRYAATLDRVLGCLWTYTNRVEIDEAAFPHALIAYLDLGRLREEAARELLTSAVEALRSTLPLTASVGLAASKFSAYLAALKAEAGEVLSVSRGDEAAFATPFPVSVLPLTRDLAHKLDRLAVRRLGEFAALPRAAVIGQFGRAGKLLYLLAQGQDGRPVTPRRMPASESGRRQFEPPITERTRLDIAVHLLAEELAERLEQRGAALHRLRVTLTPERGAAHSEELFLIEPVATARGIAESIQRLLERLPTTQPITSLEVCLAHLVSAAPRQLELFRDQPARTALLDLARVLNERYGDHCYRTELRDRGAILLERRFALRRIDAS
ncbi:MAG: hypothetical protein IPO91_29190 [Chloroflexi bacterium]|nr:hypothetical protein [Chloroflexota bacterium]